MAQARQVGPTSFGFEFYNENKTVTKWTKEYDRGLLAEYASVEGKSVGGSYGSIIMGSQSYRVK